MRGNLDVLTFFNGAGRGIGKVWTNPGKDEFFSWEFFKSVLEGVSAIDLTTFPIASLEAAQDFLLQYGVDLNDPYDVKDAADVYGEAVEFLHRVLCPPPTEGDPGLEMPFEMSQLENLPRLLLLASQAHPLQAWACALLRIMHTINHANHSIRSPYYSQIKEQVLGRYREHLRVDESGCHVLGRGEDAVPLKGVFFREEKSRESLVLKLLHKPDNVAESVFDRIGIKLVVASPLDALLVMRYFRRHHLAIFANISPGRSRNTLIDLEQFQQEWIDRHGDSRPQKTLEYLRGRTFPQGANNANATGTVGPHGASNPHTSPGWRSIQFTCRQLIRLENPIHGAINKLSEKLTQRLGEASSQDLLKDLRAHSLEQSLRFFFPYEVQIMDEANYIRSETGDSSHANYRLRQLRSARKRILGRILRA